MPARGDHEARRAEVSEAVWRVLAAQGFGGLTMRAVAAELGASTGLLTHYFRSKRELVRYAHEVAEQRTSARARQAPAAPGLAALRAALCDVLPLTPEMVAMSRVWISFWDAALGDAELGESQRARYQRWRDRLCGQVLAARGLGEIPGAADPEDIAATAASFTHGLVVQALFDPDRFPPERQLALLDGFLDSIRPGRAGSPAVGRAPGG
ncbi:TetR/AcrR family transcriptional regulator [Crossiella sp. CA198]|uniref:TetR/AcrR family transcriptional regulator n=1 Tax=Crossiella sp. CA198 TaxID=3455607 RepID=UPI003F8D7C0B